MVHQLLRHFIGEKFGSHLGFWALDEKQLLTNFIAFSTHKTYIYGFIMFICDN